MKSISGDLLKLAMEGRFEVVIHGANCFLTMNSGIAKQIKALYPEAYEADLKTIPGDKNKLGSYTGAPIMRGEKAFVIINAYTQYTYGTDSMKVDYEALRKCFKEIKKEFHGCTFGIPKIGAGLAGGDFEIISKIIEEEMAGEDITLVLYEVGK